ncbi:hypothetical protein [Bythopirellula polymerisocia]|uniref:Uncharacterized protein n=1 Tax=Bythopirellula polymerisocia TaxID=2528003 RepID=A0A5C6D623_9BACT|nr:hypothetical protein [Bythopirellula polymerisocia]TWU30319.1 hypothetical protein Pla144_11050 [Bythopirellula polymerisocia]
MIFNFLKRCFLACVLATMFVFGTVAVCCVLACSAPDFYASAITEPVDEADNEAAIKELEQIVSSMDLFLKLNASDFQKLQALPENAFATLAEDQQHAKRRVPFELKRLLHSPNVTQDTFAVSLTERHINALLSKELGKDDGELRRPHVSLEGDMIRFAVTLVTPVAEVVLSCDFELAKTNLTDLTFDLHAARVGKLPLPIATVLKQYMRTNPVLPQGIKLNIDGERPTLSIDVLPDSGDLQLEELHVADGKIHFLFRRTIDKVVVAK